MKVLAIGSILVLFAIIAGTSISPAFADHAKAEVQIPVGALDQKCRETNECYTPHEVTIDVGGEVTWYNKDSGSHTVTAGDIDEDPFTVGVDYPNGFDSKHFSKDDSYSHKFETVGTYPYFCTIHAWMTGVVHVEGVDDHRDNNIKDAHAMPESLDDIMTIITTNSEDAVQGSPLVMNIAITNLEEGKLDHVNFKVTAMQGDEVVFASEKEHAHDGILELTTRPLPMNPTDMPVDITVELLGFGVGELTGPSGQLATAQIVPEFGTIAMMILGISIISIIALGAKSRVIPRI